MSMSKHNLMSLACLVRESYSLLPSSDEIEGDSTLKHLVDAANKTTNALYSYLNDRIANAPLPTSELVKIAAEMNTNTGYCGACDIGIPFETVHTCGLY